MQREYIENGYFVTQRKLLRLGGISLKENESFLYKIYYFAVRLCFVVYLFALVSDIVIDLHDLDVSINSLYHAIAVCIVLSKLWVVAANSKRLDRTLNMLQEGVFAPNSKRGGAVEEIWINECVTNSNRLSNFAFTLAFSATSIPIVASIIKRITMDNPQHWELPFGKCSVFQPDQGLNFYFAWAFQSVLFNIAAVIYLATDFLVALVFAHICVQYKMLRNSILKIVAGDGEQRFSKEELWHQTRKLKENVSYHIAIIDLANQFEKVLNVLMLNTYLAEMLALGCIMYHCSLYPVWDPRFQKDAMMTGAVSFQVFLVSYWGNEVMLESQTVLDACYAINFVNTDVRLQKSLCFMMARSLRPVKFTAGKFVNLSLITFVAVMRASFSYYMVLRSRSDEN